MTESLLTARCVHVSQRKKTFFLTALRAADVVHISYVARRGESKERGAVQRLLSGGRIASISDFVLGGGSFPTSIILNWTHSSTIQTDDQGNISVPRVSEAAQVIDGQHRVMGLADAQRKKKKVGDLMLPVCIYTGLSTRHCADLFLSINTEQKPVAKSLVFDLYQVASDYMVDPAADRAADIARILNEDDDSPYRGSIKFPGAPRHSRGLALSTVVSAIKPMVESKGLFEQVGLCELRMQSRFIINFFSVLQSGYALEWDSSENVFRYAAGFAGAIEFLRTKLIVHCNISGDFTRGAIAKAMTVTSDNIIRRSDVSGLQGRRAFTEVAESLQGMFHPTGPAAKKVRV